MEIRISQKRKEETRPKTRVNSYHRSHQDKKDDGRSVSSNQAMNDECQHFCNTTVSKLMNYNETVRFVIQSDIMGLFFNANRGFL